MSDSVLPANPVPTVIVPPAPTVLVAPAQVWSSAIQNVVITLCVTAAFFAGKLDQSIWLAALGYIGGVDLFGRMKLHGSAAGAAAVGATGALSVLSKLPHVGTFFVALLTVLGLTSCATVSTLPAKTGNALLKVEDAYQRMDKLYAGVCLPEPVVIQVASFCSDADKGLHEEALPAINEAVDIYTDANKLLKDTQ